MLLLLVLMLLMSSQASCRPNLALYKTGKQSSVWTSEMNIGNTLDGSYGTSSTECLITGKVYTHKWGQVDLEMTYSIHSVRILNRGDAFTDRLRNFTIYVYEEDPTVVLSANRKLCVHHPGIVGAAQWANLLCESHVRGRYVRVSKYHSLLSNLLQFCELEVYGDRVNGHGIQFKRVPDSVFLNPVLSEHTVSTFSRCLQMCYAESLCWGANFRKSTGDSSANCQLMYNSPTNPIIENRIDWDAFPIDVAESRKLRSC